MSDNRDDRVALVGAAGPLGREVRDCLETAGFPGASLELLDLEEEAGLLTDYGDEARVVIEAAGDNVAGFRLVCFCDVPELVARLTSRVVEGGGVALDATGASWGNPGARLAAPDAIIDPTAAAAGLVAIPHPAALLLAKLEQAFGDAASDAAATVLLPASELGMEATEELAHQAAALLNFGEPPTDSLGRRVAFDAFPLPADEPTAELVAEQLRLLEITGPRVAFIRASVFHGLAASVHLPAVAVDQAAAALDGAGVLVGAVDTEGRQLDSPANIAGQAAIAAARPRDDGRGGCWVWLVQDNHRATAEVVVAAALANRSAQGPG